MNGYLPSTPSIPGVWVLLGRKAGDNTQVLALADALGWPFEVKQLHYRGTELFTNLLLGPNLWGIRRRQSDALVPPWPDLVISAGRRNEPVARWIQARALHPVRLVHMGRPWARPGRFDLIVTTPQYHLPDAPNVLRNTAPLHTLPEERLRAAAQVWEARLRHLPRPWIAVLVGGHSGPYTFDDATAGRLARQADALANGLCASLLVTTSARTPQAVIDTIGQGLTRPAFVYRWSAQDEDNPYLAYLALADAFIVTCESASMLTEAASRRKPVYIFPIDTQDQTGHKSLRAMLEEVWRGLRNGRHQPLVHWLLLHLGPRRMRRDIRTMHLQLIADGRAVWLGQPFPERPLPPLDDLSETVRRVKALF